MTTLTSQGWGAVLEALPEPMMLVTFDGEIRSANRAFVAISKRSRAGLIGTPLRALVQSSERPIADFLRLCARSRDLVLGSVRLGNDTEHTDYRVEGALVPSSGDAPDSILLRFAPKRAAAGKFIALNEKLEQLNQPVARRRISEKRLREQKEWLLGTLSSIGEGLIATDANGAVRLMNAVAEQLTGWSAGEALGTSVDVMFQAVDEANAEPRASVVSEALATGEVLRRADQVLTARDGSARPIQETAAPIRDDDGSVVGAVLVFRDVSRERRAEEAIRRAKDAAEAANRAKTEFLASVSHELRTPMNVVIGMTDLALGTELDAEVRDYLSTGRESANNLLRLLDDLLDLSKIEAGEVVIVEQPFNVHNVVYETVRFLAVQAAEKQLELTCLVDPDVPETVRGDEARLRQVLLNVLGNGIKFTAVGEVAVRVRAGRRLDGRTEIHFGVSDTGIGIAEADRAKIFAPFVQANSSSNRMHGGTGLGLSIVSAMIERMGGTLSLESELDEGSTFHFTLTYPVETNVKGSRNVTIPDALRRARVLVVDDHRANLDVMSSLLARLGTDPTVVDSGEEALAQLSDAESKRQPFRAVIVDGLMPGLDGRDVVDGIDPRATRTILMTSPVERRNREDRFGSVTVSAMLDKPVIPMDLIAALNEAFGQDEHVADDASGMRARRSTSLRVLLAEDTPANQKLMQALLRRAGHQVELAADGEEALALYERRSFDVILMDVQMPRVDGFDATQRVRAAEARSGRRTPIIALSAHAMAGFRERCLAAGMDDYMAKPFTGDELHERLIAVTSTDGSLPPSRDAAPVRGKGDDGLDESLRVRFLNDFDERLRRIREAVTASDSAALAREAHSLRGSSAFFHADTVTEAACMLEELGESGTLDNATETVEGLAHAIAALRSAVDDSIGG